MNMVDGSTLLTTIVVLVDDWYQQKGYRYVPLLPGPSPRFTDSEMLTLLVAMDFFPYPGEQQFLGGCLSQKVTSLTRLQNRA